METINSYLYFSLPEGEELSQVQRWGDSDCTAEKMRLEARIML